MATLHPAPSRFTSGVAPSRSTSAAGCSGCGHQQWIASTGLVFDMFHRAESFARAGRQSHHEGIFLASCDGWQQPQVQSFKGRRQQQPRIVTGALPTEVSAAATALVVGGALFALTKLNKDTETVLPAKTECEACGGSGVCPTCNGEGFVNKNLSADAAAKARATAKDAATRYTAGLAKKWNYCTTCGGGRGCQSCEADDLKSLVGPHSPKRQLAECKEPQQKFTARHLKTGLLWLSNRIDEHDEMFPNGVMSQSAEQEEPRVGTAKAEEVDRQCICSRAASPVQIHTIAWSVCESCAVESTFCTAHHHKRMGDGNRSLEVVVMEEKLKTLVDELLETDMSTYAHGACPADLGRSCQCIQLPNQILATVASSCTI